ncbi:MAG: class I SAM-dependent methyltransferase [Leptolyngbyaceae bacterium]|nr:class I SAM-dependent methyltransferase [Leptolyngbyaceae bacterium]
MESTLTKLAYQTFQQGKSYFGLAHKTLSSRIREAIAPNGNLELKPVSPDVLLTFRERLDQLIETDWEDAEKGVYPNSLLFDNPWGDVLQFYPMIWADLPQIWERTNSGKFQDFDQTIRTEGYPQYYLRNFHYQTDGYLSDQSANLYDLQVEILFNGAADPMRRRVLAPLKDRLAQAGFPNTPQTRILDVACGTGRTLRMIRGALSDVSLFGSDLSPAYLRKANQLLSEIPGELPQLIQANAEELPYLENYFHGITCVFLFHELPAPVRQHVIDECYRVTQPGGVFVICDSIQAEDSPEMAPMMENFPIMFHEPFYKNYTEDNLSTRLEQAGFTVVETQIHFASKYWIAQKPV